MPRPLSDLVDTVQLTDREIRKVMRDAAAEADRVVRSLEGVTGKGARVRSAQLALAKVQIEAWGAVGAAVQVGVGDAFDAAATYQAEYDSKLFKRAGISPAYWKQAALAQSRQGLASYLARKRDGYTLSERVYRNRAMSRGYVDRAVNNGLLLGKSAREIAKDVVGYIDPKTPGGASYAAMRLGRTEINNAFHSTSVRGYQKTPWVERVLWNLSGSHPRPDECNEYADDTHFTGGQAGEFKPMEVPAKPHPNCLCYVTPVAMDLDTYVKNFKAGKYDSYIDQQMGCVRSA